MTDRRIIGGRADELKHFIERYRSDIMQLKQIISDLNTVSAAMELSQRANPRGFPDAMRDIHRQAASARSYAELRISAIEGRIDEAEKELESLEKKK